MIPAWRKGMFILAVVGALVAPVVLIVRYETVLRKGTPFRFRARPVDPGDPFRGRYVQLEFDLSVRLPHEWKFQYEQDVYARLGTDEEGFARIEEISRTPFGEAVPYVKCETSWWRDFSNRIMRVNVPFNQYYMNEWKAPKAEKEYRRLSVDAASNVWAVVRIWKGKGVIEELYFEGRPVGEYLKEKAASP